jgi:hypothetical protein
MAQEPDYLEIEKLAGLFFSIEEIRIICQTEDDSAAFQEANLRGRLKAEADIRQVIKAQAVAGSSEAQKLMIKMWDESKKTKFTWGAKK